jgi:hypothetical protein
VSILMALLVFLVCAFAGGAVLSSAYHNASRAATAQAEQQRYLAVSSAAELLKQLVGGQSVTMQYREYQQWRTETVYDEEDPPQPIGTETWEVDGPAPDAAVVSAYTGALGQIGDQVYALFCGNALGQSVPAWDADLTLSLDDHPELSNVKGTLSIDSDSYDVTVVIYHVMDDTGTRSNGMQLFFPASTRVSQNAAFTGDMPDPTQTGDEVTRSLVENTTVTWAAPDIRPVDAGGDGS